MSVPFPADGRSRVVIENVTPEINGGRFPIKRTPNEEIIVQADILCDGHGKLAGVLLVSEDGKNWQRIRLHPLPNDRWIGRFSKETIGTCYYTLEAWVDHFASWQEETKRKLNTLTNPEVDLAIGLKMIKEALTTSDKDKQDEIQLWITKIETTNAPTKSLAIALDDRLHHLLYDSPWNKKWVTRYHKILKANIDPSRALFSSWYEFFPRSVTSDPNIHGTLADCKLLLEDIAEMGFDIIYLPPVHPIGIQKRKGKNNTPQAHENDPGSPWSIGANTGGHKEIHPELGTLQDMQDFISKAQVLGIEVAIDIAFQCSPDHPYVKQHPEWFRWRPDGSVQYAENPPKKYEDIIPFDFESEHWKELWEELASIVEYWIEQGISIFRVDNPHTKPFIFWEWLIHKIKSQHPNTLFLSEAFTRPKVMKYLAKCGFSQSYTYFTWRTTKTELIDYMTELTTSDAREYLRPNFWPNTPDILPENLQYGGKASFLIRLFLAAFLSSNYGIYGPAYELLVSTAIPGKEEYLHSEKYEVKNWDRNNAHGIQHLITLVNKLRKENPALQSTWNITFGEIDNPSLLYFIKKTPDLTNILLIIINLDPFQTHTGTLTVPLSELKIDSNRPYILQNLLTDETCVWFGTESTVTIAPETLPAQVLRLQSKIRTEADFEYY